MTSSRYSSSSVMSIGLFNLRIQSVSATYSQAPLHLHCANASEDILHRDATTIDSDVPKVLKRYKVDRTHRRNCRETSCCDGVPIQDILGTPSGGAYVLYWIAKERNFTDFDVFRVIAEAV